MTHKLRRHGRPQVNTKKKLNRWRKSVKDEADRQAAALKHMRELYEDGEKVDKALEGIRE